MLQPFKNNKTEELIILELKKTLSASLFSGDFELGALEKIVAATDNSIYEIFPKAVVFPKHDSDILILLKTLNLPQFNTLSITAKGAGTGTNGQSLNFDIILDFSRYLNKIISLDKLANKVRVQSGVVLDQLNDYLKLHGYFFPVQISTANRATIGGMLSTDASGKGSRVYGKTSDNVAAIKFWNHLGQSFEWSSKPLKDFLAHSSDEWEKKLSTELLNIYKHNFHLFKRHFPNINRGLSGYNLPALFDNDSNFNLTSLVCGSEGTLGLVSEITLKIKPIHKHQALILCFYKDFDHALSGVDNLLRFDPVSVETMDELTTTMAMQDISWQQTSAYLGDYLKPPVQCFNIIEFASNDLDSLEKKLAYLKYFLLANANQPKAPISFYDTNSANVINDIWKMRSRGVGLLSAMKGSKRPVAFVEDAAVPPQHLCDFISEFRKLLDKQNLKYGMYGHADVGCVHVRPALNLKLKSDRSQIKIISDQVQALVLKYKGIIWGEHGKGLRGEYLKDYLGDNLYFCMRQIKTLFDPFNRFNPGKLYLPISSNDQLYLIDSTPMKGAYEGILSSIKYANFIGVLDCNGNGECFSVSQQDLMCPSFKTGLDRVHSPKGRAMILRYWLMLLNKEKINPNLESSFWSSFVDYFFNRLKPKKYDFNHDVFYALDGCLSCKACTSLCPIRIDIPEYKSQFLNYYYSQYSRPVADFFVAALEHVIPYIYRFSGFINRLQENKIAQKLIFNKLGLVSLPALSSRYDVKQLKYAADSLINTKFKATKPIKQHFLKLVNRPPDTVVMISDLFLYYYDANVLKAAIIFLKKIGYRVKLTDFLPNGKGLHIKGFIRGFTKTAARHKKFIDQLAELEEPIITIEPSLGFLYRQEYAKYVGNLNTKVFLLEEFLVQQMNHKDSVISLFLKKFKKLSHSRHSCSIFGHCTQASAVQNWHQNWQTLFSAFKVDLTLVKAGCCGMAGIFGYEKRHFKESKAIFKYSWQQPIDQALANQHTIVAPGFSCRHQISRFSKAVPLHPVEVLINILNTALNN